MTWEVILIIIIICLIKLGIIMTFIINTQDEKEDESCPVRRMFPNNYIEKLLETEEIELLNMEGFINPSLNLDRNVIIHFKIDNLNCVVGYFPGLQVEGIIVECKILKNKIYKSLAKAIAKHNDEYLVRLGKSKMKS